MPASDVLDTLRRLNAQFIHNYVTNDVASHDAILHPAFICVNSNGSRTGRAAYLKRWAIGFNPDVVIYWDTRDEDITVLGNVALVRATNKHTIVRDGRETNGMTTYTDTYINESAGWLCIQAQLTAVAAGFEPGDETIVNQYIRGIKQS